MSSEKLSRIIGLRLLSIKEGLECGKIQEVVLDSQDQSVRFFVLDTGKGCFGLKVLPANQVTGMGRDYATTDSINVISDIWENDDAMSLAFTDSDLCGAHVVSSVGDVLGRVKDFDFDSEEGHILSYELEDGTMLPARDVVTLSRGYVFVNPEVPLDKQPIPQETIVMNEQEALAEQEAAQTTAAEEPVVVAVAEPEPVSVEPVVEAILEPEPVVEEPMAIAEPKAEPAAESEPAMEAPARRSVMPMRRNAAQPAADASNEAPADTAGESPKDMRSYFEKRRTEFLIGRVTKSDIIAADGSVLIAAGQIVTAEALEEIRAADKITELTMMVN